MPTAVQGSRDILGSFKDLFPKYLAQWNHGVVLDGCTREDIFMNVHFYFSSIGQC